MRFSVPLFCAATLAPFSSAWTGSDKFAPKRNAQVIFLTDGTSSEHLARALEPVRADIGDLFAAYTKAGLTLQVGYYRTGGRGRYGCMRSVVSHVTSDESLVKEALTGPTDFGKETVPAFWNMILAVTHSRFDKPGAPTRRVVVMISEKVGEWGTKAVDIGLAVCSVPPPTSSQFYSVMTGYRVGLLFAAESGDETTSRDRIAKVTKLLTEASMSDFKAVGRRTYPESQSRGRSIIPALAEMLSEDWILANTRTPPPLDTPIARECRDLVAVLVPVLDQYGVDYCNFFCDHYAGAGAVFCPQTSTLDVAKCVVKRHAAQCKLRSTP